MGSTGLVLISDFSGIQRMEAMSGRTVKWNQPSILALYEFSLRFAKQIDLNSSQLLISYEQSLSQLLEPRQLKRSLKVI